MGSVICQISMSLDGYVAGPDQSPEIPLGVGGEQLHEWLFATPAWRGEPLPEGETSVDARVADGVMRGVGAYIMGRNMFGGGHGPWDESWRGWWGDDPPYHTPVFVLTHEPRADLPMEGGTTFHFVTDGIEAALARAREAAGDLNVSIGGGASTVRQYLAAGLLDELYLHVVPLLLGSGARLLDGVTDQVLEQVSVAASPVCTHIKYRIVH